MSLFLYTTSLMSADNNLKVYAKLTSMSSTRRTEIFIEMLTLGLGSLVHFGKSHMFSASLL